MKTRSYVSDFEMILGPIKTRGRLLPIRATKDAVKLCTRDGTPVTQVYMDPQGRIYKNKDALHRGIQVKGDDKLTVIGTASKVAEVRTSQLPKNSITFSVHETEQVNEHIFPSENQGYVFAPARLKNKKPDPHAAKNYEALLAVLQDPSVTLLGKCNLANHEGLFKAGLYRGHLYLQKQLYPEDLNELELDNVQIPKKLAESIGKASRKMVENFDPKFYDDTISRRLIMLAEGQEERASDITDDIIESLTAMFGV